MSTWQEFTFLTPVEQLEKLDQAAVSILTEFGSHYQDPNSVDGATCEYTVDGRPVCLVARILDRLGYPDVEQLSGPISTYIGNGLSNPIIVNGLSNPIIGRQAVHPPVHWWVIVALSAMQGAQDYGATWGQAVNAGAQVTSALRQLQGA